MGKIPLGLGPSVGPALPRGAGDAVSPLPVCLLVFRTKWGFS